MAKKTFSTASSKVFGGNKVPEGTYYLIGIRTSAEPRRDDNGQPLTNEDGTPVTWDCLNLLLGQASNTAPEDCECLMLNGLDRPRRIQKDDEHPTGRIVVADVLKDIFDFCVGKTYAEIEEKFASDPLCGIKVKFSYEEYVPTTARGFGNFPRLKKDN